MVRRIFRSVAAAVLVTVTLTARVEAQFPPDSFENLQVLSEDLDWNDLIPIMAGFTRALSVRCTFCHLGEEGRPLATYDFASDEKATKRKAREMLRMVRSINAEHLSNLEERRDPPIRVECATCHRGTNEPRMLQDVLLLAYEADGIDSALAAYEALKDRFYGRFTYDFGEVPLADVAGKLAERGDLADAEALHALNVVEHPASAFVKRQHAAIAVRRAFVEEGATAGGTRYRDLRQEYGARMLPEGLLNQVGYALMRGNRIEEAIEAFKLNAEFFPGSANVYDSLGEAYMTHGDSALAIANYERSLELNPDNQNAKEKLAALRNP
jgi:tetratricopeptide (TPR) repeat protein